MKIVSEGTRCGLCGRPYTGWGNNSVPLSEDVDKDRCCDDCNASYVIPARIMGVQVDTPAAGLIRQMAKLSMIGKIPRAPDFDVIDGGK